MLRLVLSLSSVALIDGLVGKPVRERRFKRFADLTREIELVRNNIGCNIEAAEAANFSDDEGGTYICFMVEPMTGSLPIVCILLVEHDRAASLPQYVTGFEPDEPHRLTTAFQSLQFFNLVDL